MYENDPGKKSQEITEKSVASSIADHYIQSYCADLSRNYSGLWGAFLVLKDEGIKEFRQIMEILRDETAGERFCNNLILLFGKKTGVDEDIVTKAGNYESTSLTHHVASELGKKIEYLMDLNPKQQRAALHENKLAYANRKKAEIEKIDVNDRSDTQSSELRNAQIILDDDEDAKAFFQELSNN